MYDGTILTLGLLVFLSFRRAGASVPEQYVQLSLVSSDDNIDNLALSGASGSDCSHLPANLSRAHCDIANRRVQTWSLPAAMATDSPSMYLPTRRRGGSRTAPWATTSAASICPAAGLALAPPP